MKILIYVIPVLLAVTVRADDITLVDGKTVFHNAKIVTQDAASVMIKHSTGLARVMIPDLPPELRSQFKYDSDAAMQTLAYENSAREAFNAQGAAKMAADRAYREALAAWNRAAVSALWKDPLCHR